MLYWAFDLILAPQTHRVDQNRGHRLFLGPDPLPVPAFPMPPRIAPRIPEQSDKVCRDAACAGSTGRPHKDGAANAGVPNGMLSPAKTLVVLGEDKDFRPTGADPRITPPATDYMVPHETGQEYPDILSGLLSRKPTELIRYFPPRLFRLLGDKSALKRSQTGCSALISGIVFSGRQSMTSPSPSHT